MNGLYLLGARTRVGDWSASDIAKTVFNPAYGVIHLFQQSDDSGGGGSAPSPPPSQSAAYQAASAQQTAAQKQQAAAQAQLAAIKAAAPSSYTPITPTVPSFALSPLVGADEQGRAILIRVKNALALAASQGGAAGAIASKLVPQTVGSTVLSKMVDQLSSNLKQNGVDADVSIVADAGQKAVSGGRDLLVGVGIGVAGTGALWALWKLLRRVF